MAGIVTFFKERLPLPVYFILAGGMSLSGLILGDGSWRHPSLWVSLASLLLFFVVLRCMDEYKDYDKDLVAHPDRPLPRGVISIAQIKTMIYGGVAGMILLACLTLFFHAPLAAACYLAIVGYLWLMYREFYAGDWLSKRPLLYAVTHQVILIPLCLFTPLLVQSDAGISREALLYALLILSSFFAYEICRKLDPNAHPVLQTYLAHYGPGITAAVVVFLTLVGAIAAYLLHLAHVVWPVQGILLASLALLRVAPFRYTFIESTATLSLVVHLWIIPLLYLIAR